MDIISSMNIAGAIFTAAIARGTPVAFAAIGESITERSGVINLGVEGMMLIGAMTSIAVQHNTGNAIIATIIAGISAMLLAAIHGVLVVVLNSSQIVSGFAITFLGMGVSAYIGRAFVGVQVGGVDSNGLPFLNEIPVLGDILFGYDLYVYFSILLAILAYHVLSKTRFGLHLRASGENPFVAYSSGVLVKRTRFYAVLIGGFLSGIGGAHLALAYTKLWVDDMVAGQGWIAIGLVIVAGWSPVKCLIFSWFFGILVVVHPHLQAMGIKVSPYLIAMLPYLAAIIALTLITRVRGSAKSMEYMQMEKHPEL